MERELTTQQLIGSLIKVAHEDLKEYAQDGLKVAAQNPDLLAHMIAWNWENGEIRSSKSALPVIALRGSSGVGNAYYENAVAHLMLLDPRNLVKAAMFHRSIAKVNSGAGTMLKRGIKAYLWAREMNVGWWDRTVLQHRKSMKTLYALYHVKPNERAQNVLFGNSYPFGSVFRVVHDLKMLSPLEAAQMILKHKIPFTIATGALGGIKGNTDLILALIEGMTSAELVTNSKMLAKLGVMDNPALRAAYDNGMEKAQKDKKVSSMKAGRAASFVGDKTVKAKLEKLQEVKVEDLKQIEGDWLILGDKSGSMEVSIEKAKEIAAFLTKVISGNVNLVFFDTRPVRYEVTGKTLDEIKKVTHGIGAGGGTSIGCGLQLTMEKGIIVNGIVIVSDGGENTAPMFADAYHRYEKTMGASPTVYLLHVNGEPDVLSQWMEERNADIPYEKLEAKDLDFYGLPSLTKVLKAGRYALLDEIMQSRLLTIKEVLDKNVPQTLP